MRALLIIGGLAGGPAPGLEEAHGVDRDPA
jgi:hypothetical protein